MATTWGSYLRLAYMLYRPFGGSCFSHQYFRWDLIKIDEGRLQLELLNAVLPVTLGHQVTEGIGYGKRIGQVFPRPGRRGAARVSPAGPAGSTSATGTGARPVRCAEDRCVHLQSGGVQMLPDRSARVRTADATPQPGCLVPLAGCEAARWRRAVGTRASRSPLLDDFDGDSLDDARWEAPEREDLTYQGEGGLNLVVIPADTADEVEATLVPRFSAPFGELTFTMTVPSFGDSGPGGHRPPGERTQPRGRLRPERGCARGRCAGLPVHAVRRPP